MPKRQLINVIKTNDNNYNTKILIIEKVDGVKQTRVIESPKIKFYVTKKEYVEEYENAKISIPLEAVEEREVLFDNLPNEIANIHAEFDPEEASRTRYFIKDCYNSRQRRALGKLHYLPFLHRSDIDICDHYIDKYFEFYKDEIDNTASISKGYWDIEADTRHHRIVPDSTDAPCPINAISFYSSESGTLYGFFSRNGVEENPQIAELENNLESFRKELDEYLENMLTEKKLSKPKNIIIKFCDTELDVIIEFFKSVNEIEKPDFLLSWNQSFDLPTVINRLRKIYDGDLKDIICPKHIVDKQVYYKKDEFAISFKKKSDICNITSEAVFLDQLVNYAKIRASASEKEQTNLEFIANEEVGVSKVEYSGSIADLPYENYKTFVIYSLVDSFLLFLIDTKTGDTDLLYRLSMKTRTRIQKVMAKTTSIINLQSIVLRNNNRIMTNNRNRSYDSYEKEDKEDDEDSSFRGAFVADLELIDNVGVDILGRKSSRIHDDTFDFDFTALYPSEIIAYGIDAENQYGMFRLVDINGNFYDPKGNILKHLEEESIELIDELICREPISFGNKWFNLPSIEELLTLNLSVEVSNENK